MTKISDLSPIAIRLSLLILLCGGSQTGWANLDSLLEQSTTLQNEEELASVHLKLCREFIQLSKYEEAMEFGQKALEHYQREMDKAGEAASLLELGRVWERQKEWSQGEEAFNRSMSLFEELDDEEGRARTHYRLGELFAWKGGEKNHIKAKEHLFAAIEYFMLGQDFNRLGSAYFQLAYIAEDPGKILEFYYKVIEIARNINAKDSFKSNRLAAAYANSGGVYKDAKEYDLAVEYYQKALGSLPEQANGSNESIMNLQLGGILTSVDNIPAAKKHLFRGMNIGLEFGHQRRVQEAQIFLGELHLGQGDLDSAFFYSTKALEFNETSNWWGGRSYLLAGNCLMASGELDEARKKFAKSIEVGNLTDAYLGMAKCAEEQGDFESAFAFLTRHHSRKDSLESLNRIPAVSLAETKQEQDLLEKERRRQEEEFEKTAKERNFLQYSAGLLLIVVLLLLLNLVVRFSVPPIVIQAAAFITVLTLFEFSLVFLDPKIELLSAGEPIAKLGINLAIAIVIFPLHTFIERRITKMSATQSAKD